MNCHLYCGRHDDDDDDDDDVDYDDDADDDADGDDDDDGVGDGDDGDMIHIADVLCKEVTFHLGSNFKLDRGGIANNIGTSQKVMIFVDIMVIQMKRRRVKCEWG